MHAVLITFHSSTPVQALSEPFADYAQALCSVPGLVSKAWLEDGETLGGFHLFADRDSADRYLQSDLVAGLQAVPEFTGFTVRHFGVLDDLSRTTGISAVPVQGGMQPA